MDTVSNNYPAVHAVELRSVTKSYPMAGRRFTALESVDLTLPEGALTAIVGKSGSGKSTLLNLLAGLDRPDSGRVLVYGTELQGLDESQLARWRGRHVGVVYQFFQLLPTLTVLENVTLPMDLCATLPARRARERAYELLERVGVRDQAHKLPSALSGGQQQRVAIARALANDPPVIVADEPTGNLDSKTAQDVLELLVDLTRLGKTLVVVSHERDVRSVAHRVVTLADGRVEADEIPGRASQKMEVSHA